MAAYPVDSKARQRLRDAQRAEAEALAAVTRAQRARMQLQTKVDASELAIAAAIRQLAEVSGADRAGQLLDESTTAVRRWVHLANSSSDGPLKES